MNLTAKEKTSLEALFSRIDRQVWDVVTPCCGTPQQMEAHRERAAAQLAGPIVLTGAEAMHLVAIAKAALGLARGEAFRAEDYREDSPSASDADIRKQLREDRAARRVWVVEAVREAERVLGGTNGGANRNADAGLEDKVKTLEKIASGEITLMRYFSTPDDHCKALCPECAEAAVNEDWWEGDRRELDRRDLDGVDPEFCDHCGCRPEEVVTLMRQVEEAKRALGGASEGRSL